MQANPEYLSVNWEAGGGGAFAVIPLNEKGKLPDQLPLFRGHTATVLDTDWCGGLSESHSSAQKANSHTGVLLTILSSHPVLTTARYDHITQCACGGIDYPRCYFGKSPVASPYIRTLRISRTSNRFQSYQVTAGQIFGSRHGSLLTIVQKGRTRSVQSLCAERPCQLVR